MSPQPSLREVAFGPKSAQFRAKSYFSQGQDNRSAPLATTAAKSARADRGPAIAQSLYTVQDHFKSIFLELGISSRREIRAKLFRAPYTTCLAEHCNAKWPLTRDELRFLFFLGECADRVASQCATCRVGVVRQLSCSEAARRVELDLEVEPVRGLERDVEALCSCRSASGSDSRRP